SSRAGLTASTTASGAPSRNASAASALSLIPRRAAAFRAPSAGSTMRIDSAGRPRSSQPPTRACPMLPNPISVMLRFMSLPFLYCRRPRSKLGRNAPFGRPFLDRDMAVVEHLHVERVLAAGHDAGDRRVSGHVDRRPQHVEQAVDADDQRDTLHGKADL